MRSGSLVAAIALAMGLAACSGGDNGGSDDATPTTGSPTAESSYVADVPAGVTLTDPGSTLGLGEEGTIAWQPRQSETGVLTVSVDRVEVTTFAKSFQGYEFPEHVADRTPYFARLTITNVGEADLGGDLVPLYGVDGSGALIQPTPVAEFDTCSPGVLPDPFGAGAEVEACLVLLVPPGQQLAGVTFLPAGTADRITWSGEISDKVQPPEDDTGKGKRGRKNRPNQDQDQEQG